MDEHPHIHPDPTADEIAEMCRQIRERWSAAETNRRRRIDERKFPVETPQYTIHHRRRTKDQSGSEGEPYVV
jgi:hypothetical protein